MEDDPRFAHLASDPRFKPMPKSKKKVKIDSRFESLFTNKHFSHRMDMDKRGKPIRNPAKKNKSTMEKFYELSESDDDSSSHSESEQNEDEDVSEVGEEEPKKKSTILKENTSQTIKNSAKKTKKLTKDLSKPKLKNYNMKSESNSKEQSEDDASEEEVVFRENGTFDSEENNDDEGSDEDDDEGSDEDDDSNNSDEDDDNDNSDEDDDDTLPSYTQDFELEETDHQWNELQKDAVMVSDSTRRLAVCNMDWDFVKAQDLYVLCKSFAPEGGQVNSVAIYPSEFGKERMAEETLLGPKEIRNQNGKGGNDDNNKNNNKNNNKKGKRSRDQKQEKTQKKTQGEVQTEKLREYQLNRLKYYFAVVDCDSVSTADALYTEIDGREYQLSSVRIDLRYIPEDMAFDDEPKEMFSEGQTTVDYQPSLFSSTALCNAKVEVTWDETEFDRLSRRVAVLAHKDLENIIEENKYSDFLAPPESDSEDESEQPEWLKSVLAQGVSDEEEGSDQEEEEKEDGKSKKVSEEKKIKLYRKLLMDKLAEEEDDKNKEDKDIDKVLEWQPGIKASVAKKLKKKELKSDETAVVNQYLDKKREKKKKKRERRLQNQVPEEGADAFSDDDVPAGIEVDESLRQMMEGEKESFGQTNGKDKKKNKKKKSDTFEDNSEDEKERAELELMLMGDDVERKLSKPEIVDDSESKSKKKRKNKKLLAKQKLDQGKVKEDFVLDVEDKRFGALFTSHHFHIDPTAPQFKKTKNMMRLVDQQIKKKDKGGKKKRKLEDHQEPVPESSKSVSQSLVESLKKKMKKK